MATFDSPIEVLAFEYASFDVLAVVNNVWTWIAVVTAAVSFWRIRVTSFGDGNGCGLLEEGTKSETGTGYLESQSVAGTVAPPVKRNITKTEVSKPLVCDDGVTKGKLTMYYEVDVDGEVCIEEGDLTDVNNGEALGGNCGEWWERWEKVVKMRNGDDGWYRYVDLTVINGNVVRLWDNKGNINGGKWLN